jgi:molecular chaperone GrpE
MMKKEEENIEAAAPEGAACDSAPEVEKDEVPVEPAAAAEDAESSAAEAEKSPDWKEMYARTLADFDNFRKRTSRDREELVKFAASETVKDMLPTADNLALAIAQAADPEDPFVKGVKLAYDGFLKALKDHGAEPFESVGEVLDPNRHEAIATLPSETVEEGKISTEVKKGWFLNGRLLRAAQVVVSSGKPQ